MRFQLLLKKRSAMFAIFLAWSWCAGYAQGVLTPHAKEYYVEGKSSIFGYYEYLPPNYSIDSTAKFPLLLYLSGLDAQGDGVNDLDLVLERGVGKLINEGTDLPFLVMAPQSWSGWWESSNVDAYLDFIFDNYRVDPHRFYITGISSGGVGAFTYAVDFPEKIAAIVPVAGRGDNLDVCTMSDVPVWAFHNADDTVFTYRFSTIPIETLNQCIPTPAYQPKVTIYPQGGHDAWTKTYDGSGMGTEDSSYDAFDMDVFEWMQQFAKDTLIVDAGKDQVVFRPQTDLKIDAQVASHNGVHTYAWTQLEGEEIALDNQETSTLSVQDIPVGKYVFSITVQDNYGRIATDTIQVDARPPNEPPVVNTGEDQTIILPVDSITFLGTVSDPENDAISLAWEQESGSEEVALQLDSTQSDTTKLIVTNLQPGEYTFKLVASDKYDSTSIDTVHLSVISPSPEVILRFPYIESFEQTTEAAWESYGVNSSWEQGAPEGMIINTASDGQQAWVTNLDGNHQAHESSFLLSPVFDFSALKNDPTITYDLWQHTAPEDQVQLSYTTDQGATWQPVGQSANILGNSSQKWVNMTHTLEGLAGQKSVLFRLELEVKSVGGNEGIAVDNVIICSMGNVVAMPDTLVVEGETLILPLAVDNDDVAEATYQATSSNQEVLPDENISIQGNVMEIRASSLFEGQTEITIYSPDYCVNGTSFTLNIARVTAIGGPERPSKEILYPNPGTGHYQLNIKAPLVEARLYNLEGQLLKKFTNLQRVTPYLLDISDQPDGIFYLQIRTPKEARVHKLIKH